MKRTLILAYGIGCYAVGMASLVWLALFIGNIGVPNSVDAAGSAGASPSRNAEGAFAAAVTIDLTLIALFGLQHSVMARPTFKRWWTRFVPPAAERSTYVLFSALALFVLFRLWRPIGVVLWDVQDPAARTALYVLYGLGWAGVVAVTFLINHFDLFGLRQAWCAFRGRECAPSRFVTPGPYQVVRHPLYVGWLTVFWAAPTMTLAHFVLAAGMTVYILTAIWFEERNLAEAHPEYAEYRRRVGMLLPRVGRPQATPPAATRPTAA